MLVVMMIMIFLRRRPEICADSVDLVKHICRSTAKCDCARHHGVTVHAAGVIICWLVSKVGMIPMVPAYVFQAVGSSID